MLGWDQAYAELQALIFEGRNFILVLRQNWDRKADRAKFPELACQNFRNPHVGSD